VSDSKGFQAARAASAEVPKVVALVGRHAAVFTAVGFAFSAGACLSESLRGKKDPVNGFVGGATGGFLIGMQSKRLDYACGAALGCGIGAALLELNGPQHAHNPKRWERAYGLRKTWVDPTASLKPE
jgi:hypothetical protein